VEAAQALRARQGNEPATGILFGRERFGLNNEEVGLADEIVTFPVNPEFASLNIAQAVLLMSYEWMKSGFEDENQTAFSSTAPVPAPPSNICKACSISSKKRSKRVAISARRQKSQKWWKICAPF
jgi:tRNA/rRNA methyltransferase